MSCRCRLVGRCTQVWTFLLPNRLAPTIRVEFGTLAGPPQLLDGRSPGFVNVPADGDCLLHCLTAASNTKKWLDGHFETGSAIGTLQASEDAGAALAWRCNLAEHARASGSSGQGERLLQPGMAGYPEETDLPLIARVVGGQILFQVGMVQRVYGTGPLKLHVVLSIRRWCRAPIWSLRPVPELEPG